MALKKNATILVTGATGRQGGAAARHLLSQGFPVDAFTRNPDKASAHLLARKGARIVTGDMDDRSSLERALKGADGVFAVQNFWEHGGEGEIREGRLLIDAAKEAGVKHFVYTSVASADKDTGLSHFEGKRVIEAHLKASGLPYTILRPVFFMDNFDADRQEILQGRLRMPLPPDRKVQMIAADDIGAFAALAFTDPLAFLGKTLEIAGAELSPAQAAELFSEGLEREVRFEEAPLDPLRETAPEAWKTFSWLRDKGYEVDVPALHRSYSFLKTFGEWIHATGWDKEGDGADNRPLSHAESPMRIQ
ncbi:MAG TPA: NmrA/HSCARG family protein [Fibrobacteria bacterium]|nr:NmrA/HSCARG family protein [Fibrobacteria bacterium]